MKISNIKIESAQKSIVRLHSGQVITIEFAEENIFPFPMKQIYKTVFKGSNPAFEFWVDKLNPGEKLPRGKYFRVCGKMKYRVVNSNVKGNGK